MTDTSLAKKIGCSSTVQATIVNAPSNFTFTPPTPVDATNNLTLVFVQNSHEVETHIPSIINNYKLGNLLWIAYPKKSSHIKSDINRDTGWDLLTAANFLPVMIVSIDETWSALRFKQKTEIKKLTRKF